MLGTIIAIVLIISIVALKQRELAAHRRELAAQTQAALSLYSRHLKPGLSRKEVKNYLRAHDTQFSESCCYGERHTFETSVWVGENKDEKPWYCSEMPIYVVFEFTPGPQVETPEITPSDSDVLKQIQLVTTGTGCL